MLAFRWTSSHLILRVPPENRKFPLGFGEQVGLEGKFIATTAQIGLPRRRIYFVWLLDGIGAEGGNGHGSLDRTGIHHRLRDDLCTVGEGPPFLSRSCSRGWQVDIGGFLGRLKVLYMEVISLMDLFRSWYLCFWKEKRLFQ